MRPVGAQDRLFARMALLTPIIIICLSLFWLASGIIGIVRVNEAAQVLQSVGWSKGLAVVSVLCCAVIDIAIGVAFAFRKYAYAACWAAVGVSVFYLFASTFIVPSLWIDPLGPLTKVLPTIVPCSCGTYRVGHAIMEWVDLIRIAHVLGACVLIGTGTGIAFFYADGQPHRGPVLCCQNRIRCRCRRYSLHSNCSHCTTNHWLSVNATFGVELLRRMVGSFACALRFYRAVLAAGCLDTS